jgi:hypothetical protein
MARRKNNYSTKAEPEYEDPFYWPGSWTSSFLDYAHYANGGSPSCSQSLPSCTNPGSYLEFYDAVTQQLIETGSQRRPTIAQSSPSRTSSKISVVVRHDASSGNLTPVMKIHKSSTTPKPRRLGRTKEGRWEA